MKGLTPVIAVVLLMLITVGASATLYGIIQEQEESVIDAAPEVDLGTDDIRIEACWAENIGTDETVHINVRNENVDEAVSMEGVDLVFHRDLHSDSVETGLDEVVDPQRTHEVSFEPDPDLEDLNEPPRVELLKDGDSVSKRCTDLG